MFDFTDMLFVTGLAGLYVPKEGRNPLRRHCTLMILIAIMAEAIWQLQEYYIFVTYFFEP